MYLPQHSHGEKKKYTLVLTHAITPRDGEKSRTTRLQSSSPTCTSSMHFTVMCNSFHCNVRTESERERSPKKTRSSGGRRSTGMTGSLLAQLVSGNGVSVLLSIHCLPIKKCTITLLFSQVSSNNIPELLESQNHNLDSYLAFVFNKF